MKKGIVFYAIKERKVTLFAVIISILFGFYSYYVSPKQDAPKIKLPAAIVTAVYPGASPEDMEKLVTGKIEDKVAELDGYSYSMSYSRNSISTVVFELDYGTDVDDAWQKLREKLSDLQKELPEGCSIVDINTELMKTAGIIISMSGENYSPEELEYYAEEVKKRLSKINGISQFEITGEQKKQVRVEPEFEKLSFYRLSLEDIVKILGAQNIEIPSGNIKSEDLKINVKTQGKYATLKEIENTIVEVSRDTGEVLRLKDIARIYMDLEESNFKAKFKRQNAVLLAGYFNEDKNIIIIGKEVEKELEKFKNDLPNDINFNQVLYQPKDVSDSIEDFIRNLIIGMLLVIVLAFFSMGIRSAVIVSTAIPLTIFLTFSAMKILGINFHQVSITALIIALGMLVDNAIVITDSIQSGLDKGLDRMDACIKGTRDVAIPVLTSTLTTVGAFIPLALIDSVVGEYIISIPQIIMLSLSFSYIVAVLITPTLSYIFLRESKVAESASIARSFFSWLLSLALSHRKVTLACTGAAAVIAVFLSSLLGLQFFPKADKNMVYIEINSDYSSDIAKTEKLADEVIEILGKQPEVTEFTTAIGDDLPKFWDTLMVKASSPDFAQILVRLDLKKGKRFKKNTEFVDHLQELFDGTISSGTVTAKELEQGDPIGAPITIRISGRDYERLGMAASSLEEELRKINGTVNVRDNFSDKEYEYVVNVDTNTASNLGVTRYDIQKEVNIALMGQAASVYRSAGKEYDILVKSNVKSKEDLENLQVKSSLTGQKVLLKQVASIDLKAQIPLIQKYDRDFCVTVHSDIKSGGSSVKIQDQLKNRMKDMELDDVIVTFAGEQESIDSNFGDVGVMAVFAVLLIYIVLLIQFNSFVQPLIILLTIPLSAIGSVAGLLLCRQPLSFTGLLGIVSLFGIVVNNAIILIDFINLERQEGKSILDACSDAVEKRFRPIMLSTTTTIVGLLPLVFLGSELFTPLAISIVSGLLVSTILTMVLIPVIYSIVETKLENFKSGRQSEGIDTTVKI